MYAKHLGAVAAPTAGLHFDDAMLALLKQQGIQFAYVTLHVGAGTFQPVRVENIAEHKMHSELYSVPEETVQSDQENPGFRRQSHGYRHHGYARTRERRSLW